MAPLGGCDFLEHSAVPAPSARLFWHEALDSSVLQACAGPVSQNAVPFDLRLFWRHALVLVDHQAEHLSLSDGFHRIRIDVFDGTLLAGPVTLRFRIADDLSAPAQIHALAQFRAFRRRGVFGAWLHRQERHAHAWILQLRALDAREDGASEREIAAVLFSNRSAAGWREGDDSLRSTVRRLIGTARRIADRDYRALLR